MNSDCQAGNSAHTPAFPASIVAATLRELVYSRIPVVWWAALTSAFVPFEPGNAGRPLRRLHS
jgi:hypothetical protein